MKATVVLGIILLLVTPAAAQFNQTVMPQMPQQNFQQPQTWQAPQYNRQLPANNLEGYQKSLRSRGLNQQQNKIDDQWEHSTAPNVRMAVPPPGGMMQPGYHPENSKSGWRISVSI